MAALILPQRFTSQPQYAAPIDWSNPINQGLNFAWGGSNEHVAGLARPSLNNRVYSRSGAAQYIAGSGNVIQLPGYSFPLTSELTMIALVDGSAGNLFSGIFGKWDALNARRPGFGSANGFLTLSNYSSAGGDAALGNTPTAGLHTLAAVQTVSGGAIGYVDGVVSGTNASARSWDAQNDTWNIGCFRGGNTGENFTGATYFAACFTRALSPAEIGSLTLNPWQLFKAPPRRLWVAGPAVQLLRPGSDITAGTWTPSSGASLFAMLNESVASDATFDLTSQASTFEVGMTAGTSPGVTTGHVVRYRLIGAVTVSLRQGATTIASWSQSPTAMTTYVQTLTSLQAAAITNYSALKLQFQAV